MADILDSVSKLYDFVVIDASPITVVSDAMPLISRVSGVIIVSWLGKITRDAGLNLTNELASLNASALGVVANRVKRRAPAYYYGYGYEPEEVTVSALKGERLFVGRGSSGTEEASSNDS
jgi:Mrp family chromosome partitioning ATPase